MHNAMARQELPKAASNMLSPITNAWCSIETKTVTAELDCTRESGVYVLALPR